MPGVTADLGGGGGGVGRAQENRGRGVWETGEERVGLSIFRCGSEKSVNLNCKSNQLVYLDCIGVSKSGRGIGKSCRTRTGHIGATY